MSYFKHVADCLIDTLLCILYIVM